MMKARYIKNLVLTAVAGLCIAACVYPFEIDSETEGGQMVIEGSLYAGEISKISVSYTIPLGQSVESTPHPESKVWVEDNNGQVYNGQSNTEEQCYDVDLTKVKDEDNLRLHVVNKETGREYVTNWLDIHKLAFIDSLSYSKDTIKNKLNIELSMHCNGESWYRWSYDEDWQYHSPFYSYYKYEPPVKNTATWNNGKGVCVERPYEEHIYYCYDHNPSSEIMVFSTETQSEDRFVDLEFHKIDRTDLKISYIYRIEVHLEAISKDAYDYWSNIKTNSDYNGNLFTPNPSEMTGNIRCVNDTTEFVFGYISAARRASKHMYFSNIQEHFHIAERVPADMYGDISSEDWYEYHKERGWIPLYIPNPMDENTLTWASKRCVDCRTRGGVTKRPDWWIKDMEEYGL